MTDRAEEVGAAAGQVPIEVYWRPGCPACRAVLGPLRRSGLAVREVNIWTDPEAAARVRAANGGDETVPLVIIDGHELRAPSAGAVFDRLRLLDPQFAAALPPTRPDPVALAAPVLVLGIWVALAWRRPEVTYHFAPLIAAGIAAVLTRRRFGRPLARGATLLTASVGVLSSWVATAVLVAADHLRGPDLTGGHHALVEAVMFALIGGLLGAWYAARSPQTNPPPSRTSP